MAIVDTIRAVSPSTNKDIVIHTEHGQVYVNSNFSFEPNQPFPDFVKITDCSDGRIFWFNKYSIVWIGPR